MSTMPSRVFRTVALDHYRRTLQNMRTYHIDSVGSGVVRKPIAYQETLNTEQLAVVVDGDGLVLILAGPGSGKTRTLVYRVAYLLERGIAPQEIMLATFTNKASREMLTRVEQLVGMPPKGLWGGTFHHLGHMVLRTYGDRLGYQPTFGILDEEDSRQLIDVSAEGVVGARRDRYLPSADVLSAIFGFSVNTQQPIPTVVDARFPQCAEVLDLIVRVAESYTRRKQAANVLDYDDLLEQWRVLMVQHVEVRQRLSQQLRYILVDEFQDTNRLQWAIIQQLMGVHRNVMVVGDDAQGIYSFRGAAVRNILEFPGVYPETKIFKLEVNYRSVPEILHLANDSIACNANQFRKTLRSTKVSGALPIMVYVEDASQQAAFVAQRLVEIVDGGVRLAEIGVLFRAKYHSAELELELIRRGVLYVVRGGVRFFEQAHIKDVLAYLRVASNPEDELAWKRILMLEPGIGKRLADQMWSSLPRPIGSNLAKVLSIASGSTGRFSHRVVKQWNRVCQALLHLVDGQKVRSPAESIRYLVDNGYSQYALAYFRNGADRLDDIEQLANFASGYDSCDRFLADVSLREGFKGEQVTSGRVEENEHIVLSTIHQAKGLEWSVVVIIGMAEGQFPHSKSLQDQEQLEEERRLFYVAVTRAKDQLYVVVPMTRMTQRGSVITKPSLFIRELPQHRYETWRASSDLMKSTEDSWLID